jgi:hypothetical protein
MVDRGELNIEEVSLSTVHRFMKAANKEKRWIKPEDRRAFEKEHVNDMWQIDTSHGPYFYPADGSKARKLYIIAIIDDASRMIVGHELFFEDNAANVQKVIKQAMTRYGIPKVLYTDNGSPYKNKQLDLIMAQLGVQLKHAKVRSGASKGKIERTFRTLKDNWMPNIDYHDFETLEAFNESLNEFIREKNNRIHRMIDCTPWQKFQREAQYIKRKNEWFLDRAFLNTVLNRRVNAVGVINFDSREFEVGYKYIMGKVTLKYYPDFSKVFVQDGEDLVEIFEVNKVENSKINRRQVRLTDTATDEVTV